MKRNGSIGIPEDGRYRACKFEITCFDERDARGLDGGRIDHLIVSRDGERIAEYSGGWILEPTCRQAEMAVSILIYEYN